MFKKRRNRSLKIFLDFLVTDAEMNPDKLVPYTEEMLKQDKELVKGVELFAYE